MSLADDVYLVQWYEYKLKHSVLNETPSFDVSPMDYDSRLMLPSTYGKCPVMLIANSYK